MGREQGGLSGPHSRLKTGSRKGSLGLIPASNRRKRREKGLIPASKQEETGPPFMPNSETGEKEAIFLAQQ